MSKRPDFPWLSPYLVVQDAQAAIDFYQQAFGFELKEAIKGPEGKVMHVEMRWRDALIMFSPEGSHGCPVRTPASSGTTSPVSMYVYCDNVDSLFARATEAGAKGLSSPQDAFYGDRNCQLVDPNGYTWCFATPIPNFDCSKLTSCSQGAN